MNISIFPLLFFLSLSPLWASQREIQEQDRSTWACSQKDSLDAEWIYLSATPPEDDDEFVVLGSLPEQPEVRDIPIPVMDEESQGRPNNEETPLLSPKEESIRKEEIEKNPSPIPYENLEDPSPFFSPFLYDFSLDFSLPDPSLKIFYEKSFSDLWERVIGKGGKVRCPPLESLHKYKNLWSDPLKDFDWTRYVSKIPLKIHRKVTVFKTVIRKVDGEGNLLEPPIEYEYETEATEESEDFQEEEKRAKIMTKRNEKE